MAKGIPNFPNDALSAANYALEVDRTEIAQFSEVSGLASEIDVIELKENSITGPIMKILPGAQKSTTLTLKRAKNSSQELWKWHEAILHGKLADARRNGSVVLKAYDGTEVARYNFENAWVSKIETGTLKAGNSALAEETVTIKAERIERVL